MDMENGTVNGSISGKHLDPAAICLPHNDAIDRSNEISTKALALLTQPGGHAVAGEQVDVHPGSSTVVSGTIFSHTKEDEELVERDVVGSPGVDVGLEPDIHEVVIEVASASVLDESLEESVAAATDKIRETDLHINGLVKEIADDGLQSGRTNTLLSVSRSSAVMALSGLTLSGVTLQNTSMNRSISRSSHTCPEAAASSSCTTKADVITVVNPVLTAGGLTRYKSEQVTVKDSCGGLQHVPPGVVTITEVERLETVPVQNSLLAHTLLTDCVETVVSQSECVSEMKQESVLGPILSEGEVRVGSEIVGLVMAGYSLEHVEKQLKTEPNLAQEIACSSMGLSTDTSTVSDHSVPSFVAAETVVTTTVPKKLQSSGCDDLDIHDISNVVLSPAGSDVKDITSSGPGWHDWPQQLTGDTQLIQTENSGVKASRMDSSCSRESFVALVPDQEVGQMYMYSNHEASIREITKRERDREKKRELRANPQFRERERREAKMRMKLKRADPAYREYERMKDRVRRRQARQRNDQARQRERERDKEHKRIQRHGIPSVMTQVDMANLASGVMENSEDDSNFPTHEKTYKLMIWD